MIDGEMIPRDPNENDGALKEHIKQDPDRQVVKDWSPEKTAMAQKIVDALVIGIDGADLTPDDLQLLIKLAQNRSRTFQA